MNCDDYILTPWFLQERQSTRYDAELIDYGIRPDRIRKYGFGFRGKEVVIVE